jgi:hypothetical protein
LFLSPDGITNFRVRLKVDEAVNPILAAEPFYKILLVLEYSAFQATGNAYV